MLPPAAIVNDDGDDVNWAFDDEDDVTTRSAFPVLEMLNVRSLDFPISTLPNEILVVEREISGTAAAIPFPETEAVTVASSGSLLVMVRVPALTLAEVGVKVTATSWLWPADTVKEVVDTVN